MRKSTHLWLAILAVMTLILLNSESEIWPGLEERQQACWNQLQAAGAIVEVEAALAGEYPESVAWLPNCPIDGTTLTYTKGGGERPYQLHCGSRKGINPEYNGITSCLCRR